MTYAQRGFTLLEVLVASALLGMVMTALVLSLRSLGNTRVTVESVSERVDELRTVSSFLRGTIGAALPLQRPEMFRDPSSDIPPDATFFQGDSESLVWVAPVVAGTQLGGAYAMQLSRDGDRLVLRWHPYKMDIDESAWESLPARTLLESVQEFSVAYLPEYGFDWESEWLPQVIAPAAVRLRIKARDRFWPDLVVRLNGELYE